ncbi:MAG: beta-lactamase family protein [Ruminococcus sp.]|nr:beta-lactamase family protein [Ruminococcus sp.]
MKRITALLLAAVLLCCLTACGKSTEEPQPTTETITQAPTEAGALQMIADAVIRQSGFEGVVMITQNGEVLAQSAVGNTNREPNAPVTPDTRFCVASVSKQFAATAIMLLQEQGLLSTSDTIDAYFPDFVYGGSITIQNLLSMRSGLFTGDGIVPNSGEAPSLVPEEYGFSYDNTMEENRQAALAWLFEQPLNFEPGTRYEYSNSNYFLLAQIVEQVAGMPYEDFVRQRIFEPLGMNRSGFIHELWHEDDVALPPAADAENFEAPIASGVLQGAADLVTTAGDIDKWLTALRQKTLLSEESYAEMTQDYSPDDGKYGYGLMLHMPNGIGHTGMLSAYTSLAYTRPDKGYNFFAVSNNKASVSDELLQLATMLAGSNGS